MTTAWLLLLAGLLGLAIGSFLNVCIYRLPLEQSLAYPPSRCMACNRRLSWFENVPVFAWLVLGGKCRTCRTAIPAVYPMVEAFTGLMFVWAAWQYGPGWLLFSRLLLGCALIVLFFIDLHHRILPNVITVPGTIVGFILSFITPPGWVSSLIGLVIGGLIPLLLAEAYLRIRKIEGLGMGDVKMLALIGAFLGWQLVLFTLALGSFLGSFVGIGLILSRKGDMKLALPFGTFLAIAAMVAAVAGDSVIAWYIGLYR
jgi:leader peptidase (prepilin peptidase) / N-methyltransferase